LKLDFAAVWCILAMKLPIYGSVVSTFACVFNLFVRQSLVRLNTLKYATVSCVVRRDEVADFWSNSGPKFVDSEHL